MTRKFFPGQLDSERVYISIREHWFRLFLKIILWLIISLPYLVINLGLRPRYPQFFTGNIGNITELVLELYLLLLIVAFFILWILYYLNLHIITNIRVVDIDQVGLFKHVLSELNIDKVEDVTSDTSGIFGTLLGYGNVYIQTAGTTERFEFSNIPNPSAVVKLIQDLYEQEDAISEGRKART